MAIEIIPQAKTCTKCGESKPPSAFSPKSCYCKPCNAERAREYHARNKDRANASARAWKAANPQRVSEYNREHYAENLDHNRNRYAAWALENSDGRRLYMRRWYDANPGKHAQYNRARANDQTRLENAIRCRIWYGITRGSKAGRRTMDVLGFTTPELMRHLERQFSPGMTWKNYGKWHVDHIVPLSSFEYSTPDEPAFKVAWALTNLRPLWATDNLAKGAKRLTLL